MVEIVISEAAYSDLAEIHAYIAKDSVKYADRQVQKIIGNIDTLVNFPLAGKILDEDFSKDVRILISGNYHIIYWLVDNKRVEVLRIYHTKQIPISYINLFQ